jgi:hypothetical protein
VANSALIHALTPKYSMASILSYVPVVNWFVSDGRDVRIDIPPVEVHQVETAPEKRPRTLKHLLRANHVNHSVIYHSLQFDNHMPHILCSAYLLGADEKQLHTIYDDESESLEPWRPSPAEIVRDDWRDFLGDKKYQRAYVDFFEDSLAINHGYRWKKVVEEFMYSGKQPLVNGLIGGRMFPWLMSRGSLLTCSSSRTSADPSRLRLRDGQQRGCNGGSHVSCHTVQLLPQIH